MSKMVARIGKMLLQAEGEREAGNTEAADNMMDQVMRLSAAYSIDLALARAEQVKKHKAETPEQRSFQVGLPGQSKSKNAHFVDLMLAICAANDVEVTISMSNTYVHGNGMPSDLDMCERFYALLAPQMVKEADDALKAGANGEVTLAAKRVRVEIPESERAWGQHDGGPSYASSCYYDDGPDGERWDRNQSYPPPKFKNEIVRDENGDPVMEEKWVSREDARVWRVNFYQGFVQRTRIRLYEAKKQALRDAGIDTKDESDSRGIALRDKKKEVRDFFEEENKFVLSHGGTYNGAEVSRHSYAGQLAGDEAGSRAVLGNEKDLRG